tara:strand:+ start:8840 stop:9460 length:621 start_codon:yes stop_codon:yes gene_type:complete
MNSEENMKGFFKEKEEDINPLVEKYPKRRQHKVFSGYVKEEEHEAPPQLEATPCKCAFAEGANAIMCDKHKCIKSKSLHHLCQTRMDYYEMWESGEGPMQDPISQMQYLEKPKDPFFADKTIIQTKSDDYTSGFFMGDPEIPIESRGLGDTVAKITKATGIKRATKTVFGAIKKDCGCKERQNKLNKLFPYKKGEDSKRKTKGFFE